MSDLAATPAPVDAGAPADKATPRATDAGKARNKAKLASLQKAREEKAKRAREKAEREKNRAPPPAPAQPGIGSPQDLAQLLAELDVNAQVVSAGAPRVNFVVRSLAWGEGEQSAAGMRVRPTPRALMACQMMWPALLRWGVLDGLSDNVMFGLGCMVLLGPAVGSTIAVLRAPPEVFRRPQHAEPVNSTPPAEQQPAQSKAVA